MSINRMVSVIIPTYKRADTLERAVNSVLEQDYSNLEIIVVDDNNPNTEYRAQTEKIMKRFSNNNIKYIKHKKNKNGSAARNTGIRNADGDFIMFLDDDDEFINNKVKSQVTALEALDRSWGACYTNYIRKKNDKIIAYGAEKREGNLLKEELMRDLFIHAGSNLMIKRNVVQEVGGFDETFQRNQDIEFIVRILMHYKLAYVDEIGLVVHAHENSIGKEKYEKITKDYLKKFGSLIDSLDTKEQTIIYKMINLQLFRNFITTRGKRGKAYKLIRTRKVNIFLALRYFFHLVSRKISKKSYGFDLK